MLIDIFNYFLFGYILYFGLNKLDYHSNIKENDYTLTVGYSGILHRKIIIDMKLTAHLLVCGLSGQGKSKCVEYAIRNKCDYRVILDIISALNDEELEMEQRVECALFQFYGNDELDTVEKVLTSLNDIQIAIVEMMKIINFHIVWYL